MSDPAPPGRNSPGGPLQSIRDDLQRLASEAASTADRVARRRQLNERLAGRFKDLVTCACGLLAQDDGAREAGFFAALANGLLAFNETLREVGREYPRFEVLERLEKASLAGVPALDTAASLMLVDPEADAAGLARGLEEIQRSPPHAAWPMWLTYVLDQLVNSHGPPAKDTVPPATSRAEWRRAELAFGCVLFSEAGFHALQDSVVAAASLIDDALKCGGHAVPSRPPARVRDLLSRYDARALEWYAGEPPPAGLLQPPASVERITEPASLRRQLDEVWTAANCLQVALDRWAGWSVELQERGDAHPAVALNCFEMARRAVRVLVTFRPNASPFDRASEAELLATLPPLPDWSVGGVEAEGEPDHRPGGLVCDGRTTGSSWTATIARRGSRGSPPSCEARRRGSSTC
jgi:hypothetical protein